MFMSEHMTHKAGARKHKKFNNFYDTGYTYVFTYFVYIRVGMLLHKIKRWQSQRKRKTLGKDV